MLGCTGMFGGKMGATSQNIPYIVESAADAETSIGNLQYLLNNNFNKIVQLYSPIATYESSLPSSNVNQIKLAAATTTNTTTTTPSTPTASTTSTNSTKVLAKTGEDVRLVAGGGMLVLAAAIYIANLRVKLGKY